MPNGCVQLGRGRTRGGSLRSVGRMETKDPTGPAPASAELEPRLAPETLRSVARHLGAVTIASRRAAAGLRQELLELETANGSDPAGEPARELVESVIARTEEVRATCERLLEIVRGAGDYVNGAPPRPSGPAPGHVLTPLGNGASPARGLPRPVSEGIRVLVTRMALAGAPPEEIASSLGSQFGILNAEDVVARILGEQA